MPISRISLVDAAELHVVGAPPLLAWRQGGLQQAVEFLQDVRGSSDSQNRLLRDARVVLHRSDSIDEGPFVNATTELRLRRHRQARPEIPSCKSTGAFDTVRVCAALIERDVAFARTKAHEMCGAVWTGSEPSEVNACGGQIAS